MKQARPNLFKMKNPKGHESWAKLCLYPEAPPRLWDSGIFCEIGRLNWYLCRGQGGFLQASFHVKSVGVGWESGPDPSLGSHAPCQKMQEPSRDNVYRDAMEALKMARKEGILEASITL
jgi:hypothetical protein